MIGIPAALIAGIFHIEKVTVVGNSRYTSDEIKDKIFTSAPDNNSLCLYLKYKYFTNIKMPFVEKVDVAMDGTHSINVTVYEKMIAGCVDFLGEYLYFDKDGIVVESSSRLLDDVPVIKGLQFDKINLNEKLEVKSTKPAEDEEEELSENTADLAAGAQNKKLLEEQKREQLELQNKKLFDTILNLTQLINKYGIDVDVISFSSNGEVTLNCGGNKVLLGKKDNYDEAFAELKNLLDEAEGMKLVIDMKNYVKGTDTITAKPAK